jgi:enamine deaminase RidA (YjgF/YER057c/UK114 family)
MAHWNKMVTPPFTSTQTLEAKQMETQKKDTQSHGMPWEAQYGYAQGLQQDGIVWLAGQVGHDEHGIISGDMETQMRHAYANIQKLLAGFDMTMADVVDEVLYVLDNDTAFAARQKLGREVYPDPMLVPSTMIGVARLSVARLNIPAPLVEIKVVAKKSNRASRLAGHPR